MAFQPHFKITGRAATFLSLLFLTQMTQAIEPTTPPNFDDRRADSDVGKISIFEIPLAGQIMDFGFRHVTGDGGPFDDLDQQSVFVDFRLPWQWSAGDNVTITPRLTLTAGRFTSDSENRAFGSLGPTFRFESDRSRIPMFLDLGISPTVIDGAQYGDRDLGTSFNFTSHVAFGLRFGRHRQAHVSLRYQHISNGGTNSTNPGVDMIGIEFVIWSRT